MSFRSDSIYVYGTCKRVWCLGTGKHVWRAEAEDGRRHLLGRWPTSAYILVSELSFDFMPYRRPQVAVLPLMTMAEIANSSWEESQARASARRPRRQHLRRGRSLQGSSGRRGRRAFRPRRRGFGCAPRFSNVDMPCKGRRAFRWTVQRRWAMAAH